ncbi:hypothetical protein NM208_g9785 [Fusarium decemcellulare]|uniref:Uncharacterized protein n=1 Tax=Fusarium decemcellulare TaxID=57161 RepID=A0ACC1S0B9_9HYPO|nr:hypothetical protein NM208_g9785 [Fusarium decemcellulare]
MIISAATSPVTQLAINYPMREKEVPSGAYTRATRRAILLGIGADKDKFESPMHPLAAFCSTGNCTFDRYHTLGVCTKTANITSQLKVGQFDDLEATGMPVNDTFVSQLAYKPPEYKLWKASLPGGYDLVHHYPAGILLDVILGNETFGFQNQQSLLQSRIGSMLLIYSTPIYKDPSKGILTPQGAYKMTKEIRHEALEVAYHLCVQTFETKVQAGIETTHMVESLAKPLGHDGTVLGMNCSGSVLSLERTCDPGRDQWNKTLVLESPGEDSSTLKAELGNFSTNYHAMEKVADQLKAIGVGYMTNYYYPPGFSDSRTLMAGYEFITALAQLGLFYHDNLLNHTTRNECVKNMFSNLAISLSSVKRENSRWNLTRHGYNITGKAWVTESYVEIRWGWLSFLAFELALAASVLVLTVVAQGRSLESDEADPGLLRDLKDSSLATLVALDNDSRMLAGNGLQSVNELKKTAKELRVRVKGNQLVPVDIAHSVSA